ncbi:uncharacterized protein LOC8269478 [Ricinus communis]|uniref:uncharacterized protein LOC8269478 n=1 Tax=Ricinus communis TaxID=3988 RepID=UPI00201A7E48|nr:uncharacterized protein LOC8269478 [Ricinus communis]
MDLEMLECVNNDLETKLIKAIIQDDKSQLFSLSTTSNNTSPISISKLLHLCCSFDSVNCATSLVNGSPTSVNEVDASGTSPLHAAAEAHASRCVEMLLRKRARTDLKTRDGHGLLPLELSLYRTRMDVIWDPDNHSIEELLVQLNEKDLTTIQLLSEKTKEIDDVAYACAVGGRVVDLAALLVVAPQKMNELILELHDADSNSKLKTTIYQCVIREALSCSTTATTTSLSAAKRKCSPTKSESDGKRKLLLCQIELLQLFGAVAQITCTDKKMMSPLIVASQAGDEAIIELLLKTNIDINDVDAEGNSALHWCLRTSKGSCSKQIKIMWLLLKHGAQVSQKNKLGLTAVHIASGNGNTQALKILLLEDPDSVNSKTETKETPLFFAVKNDCKDCAELLLHWGASTEVFNLRKQRPVDLAQSQDMRFLLNPTNISLTNSSLPIRQRYTAWLQGDEVISETCEELLTMKNESNTADRTCSNMKTAICKYFESPTGCVRGSKCFYAHAGEELRQMKERTDTIHSPPAWDLERKIFVGGLPPSVNSDLLQKLFGEKFGSVDDAIVIGVQAGDKIQSRGFGFVTFKHKESVSKAVEEHYVAIMGKQIEIKSAIPKYLLLAELQKSPRQREQGQTDQHLLQEQMLGENNTKGMVDWLIFGGKAEVDLLSGQMPNEKTEKNMPSYKTIEEAKSRQISWVDTLVSGQPKVDLNKSKIHKENIPKWLRTFKKWLPDFLQQVAKRDGEYALSSLKADFRSAFGLELDHASLGFSKLSDFMRSFPDLCRIMFVAIGRHKPANHMILLPNLPKSHSQRLQPLKMPRASSSDGKSEDAKGFQDQDVPLVSNKNDHLTDCSSKLPHQMPQENPGDTDKSTFLQFLKTDLIFHARSWLFGECDRSTDAVEGEEQMETFKGPRARPQERHMVLEALARKRKSSSVFFLREFDFYFKHRASVVQSRCFGCNRRTVLWANFPCQHLLWCANCRLEIILAASGFEHKCVVCDIIVQKIGLISPTEYHQPHVTEPRSINSLL